VIWKRAAYAAGLAPRQVRALDPPGESALLDRRELPEAPVLTQEPPEHPDGLPPGPSGAPGPSGGERRADRIRRRVRDSAVAYRLGFRVLPLGAILALAAFVRYRQLAAVGLNSDEAVYTGSAEALAGHHGLESMFPVFRAHPVLVQLLIGQALRVSDTDWTARAVPAALGVVTVGLTYLLGRRLYGAPAGLAAAALLAVMPYHVMVSREVLLDGPMTCFATLALYCVVRAAESAPRRWIAAAGAALGLAALSKETAVVLLAGLYAFGALGSAGRLRFRHHAIGLGVFTAVFAVYPVALRLSAVTRTGQNFVLWQMLRRANHPLWFYLTDLPSVIGPAVLLLAAAGLVWRRRDFGWRERLLLAWILVPLAFFTIWPVKGFQYLLPVVPALAVLAGRTIGELWAARDGAWPSVLSAGRRRMGFAAAAGVCAAAGVATLAVPTWQRITPSSSTAFLAGTGGLPGGRAAGQWIAANVPDGARLLGAGPSIANVLEFYGRHPVGALSVSTDPRNRNPVYTPVANPDRAVRTGEYQYLVWDSYTAARSPYYAAELRKLIGRYHGVAVFTATVPVQTPAGASAVPVIIVYEVHP